MNAFDGEIGQYTGDWAVKQQGQGSYIQANFPDEATVTKFKYVQRHDEKNKGIRLTFSDGSSQDFELESSTSVQTLVLEKVVVTTFVKITVLSVYPKYPYFTGANEIIFHGCAQRMYRCMDAWMHGWMDAWMDAWMHGWMDGWMDAWMDGWMDGCMHACMDGWMDGWMHVWMDVGRKRWRVGELRARASV